MDGSLGDHGVRVSGFRGVTAMNTDRTCGMMRLVLMLSQWRQMSSAKCHIPLSGVFGHL